MRAHVGLPRTVKLAIACVIMSVAVATWLGSRLVEHPLAVIAFGMALGVPVAMAVNALLLGPSRRVLRAIGDGLLSYSEQDYGLRIASVVRDADFQMLVSRFNRLGEVLRATHNDIYQKEMMLETVLEAAPIAIVLANEAGRVSFANGAAREAFAGGRPIEGFDIHEVWRERLPIMLEPDCPHDGLITVEGAGGQETVHTSRQFFQIGGQEHTLFLLRWLTREVAQKEAEVWKTAIRMVGHELNNSLAPITSLVHSARLIQRNPEHAHRLAAVFDTIEERAAHLKGFLDGYVKLAKLPRPTPRVVGWDELLSPIERLYPFRRLGTVPEEPGWLDPAQLEQVLINLLKNAAESGSLVEEVFVEIVREGRGFEIRVHDRGKGMKDEELREALLPFYSTKKTGSGLGLALCRDVVDAHGGRISIARRAEGGVTVSVWLPDRPPVRGERQGDD